MKKQYLWDKFILTHRDSSFKSPQQIKEDGHTDKPSAIKKVESIH